MMPLKRLLMPIGLAFKGLPIDPALRPSIGLGLGILLLTGITVTSPTHKASAAKYWPDGTDSRGLYGGGGLGEDHEAMLRRGDIAYGNQSAKSFRRRFGYPAAQDGEGGTYYVLGRNSGYVRIQHSADGQNVTGQSFGQFREAQ